MALGLSSSVGLSSSFSNPPKAIAEKSFLHFSSSISVRVS